MKPQLYLFFAIAFVIGLFTITSSGQEFPENVGTTTEPTYAKADRNLDTWFVVVTDSTRGKTRKIAPKKSSKLNVIVIVIDYPPLPPYKKQPVIPNRLPKNTFALSNENQKARSVSEIARPITLEFLPTASPILVNPAVRKASFYRQKDR